MYSQSLSCGISSSVCPCTWLPTCGSSPSSFASVPLRPHWHPLRQPPRLCGRPFPYSHRPRKMKSTSKQDSLSKTTAEHLRFHDFHFIFFSRRFSFTVASFFFFFFRQTTDLTLYIPLFVHCAFLPKVLST